MQIIQLQSAIQFEYQQLVDCKIVLLRCHIFQGRSASVGVSLKKSVVGSVTVFIRVH